MRPLLGTLVFTLAIACAGAAWPTPTSKSFRSPLTLSHATRSPHVHAQNVLAASDYTWETLYFTQLLDHFGFPSGEVQTFQQKYLVNTDAWTAPNKTLGVKAGPIFFYTGNEGDIETFADNTGFMWDIAEEFGAILVFAEHRYYGTTLPFGNETFANAENLRWLTSEQALADFADLITALRKNIADPDTPVVLFGGSYGGMLSAWMRFKYPHLVNGAIAASAPILQFEGIVDSRTFSKIVTKDFHDANPYCAEAITQSWDIMEKLAATEEGRSTLSDVFSLCKPLDKAEQVTSNLYDFLSTAYTYMAMVDYPYEASFLGPMPGYPVRQACTYFTRPSGPPNPNDTSADIKVLRSVAQAANVFYNWTGEAGSCFDISGEAGVSSLGMDGWDYQSCTEMVMPIGQNGGDVDMFWNAPWNLTGVIEGCQERYGTTPRPAWIPTHFGATPLETLSAYSEVVFSNGDLDPWSGGGVLSDLNPTCPAVIIKGGAHHLDLRASNENDPPSVIAARNTHRAFIRKWVEGASTGGATSSSGLSIFIVIVMTILATLSAVGLLAAFYNKCHEEDPQGYDLM